jgi:hypothetical protein
MRRTALIALIIAAVTFTARADAPQSIIKTRGHTLTVCSHAPLSSDPGMMACGSRDITPSDAVWLRGWLDKNFR